MTSTTDITHTRRTPQPTTSHSYAEAVVLKVMCNGFYSARNARIASAVLATAIPSVRLSVRHTPVLCQNDGT